MHFADELIQKTHASLRQTKPLPTVTPWTGFKWLAPAAVILLAAGVLFVVQSYWQDSAQTIEDKSVTHRLTHPAMPMAPTSSEPIARKAEEIASVEFQRSARIVPAEDIPDKPPFAPAIAIELWIWPKPDQMQVTTTNTYRRPDAVRIPAGDAQGRVELAAILWAETIDDSDVSVAACQLEYGDKIDVQQHVNPARLKTTAGG
jgi:hypothetical protein